MLLSNFVEIRSPIAGETMLLLAMLIKRGHNVFDALLETLFEFQIELVSGFNYHLMLVSVLHLNL